MIYVYRRHNSTGARDLAEALEGQRIRDVGRIGIRPQDIVVCWGERLAAIRGVKVLNGAPLIDKFAAAIKLKEAGVATVEVSRERRANVVGGPAAHATFNGAFNFQNASKAQVRVRIAELQAFVNAPDVPARVAVEWLPRSANHIGGTDLLHPPAHPDFWVKKENLVREFRIHCFEGKSIRAGVKGHRAGQRAHDWIRSYDGGWTINYGGFSSTKPMRALAAKAVEALGLQFGAVDIGEKAEGGLIVLEVNRAPGLEGNTIVAYKNAINGVIG